MFYGGINLEIKRFWALDSRAYEVGALNERTRELLGLTTSMVLKCDDCVTYHIVRCVQLGFPDMELLVALNVALVLGGSITLPNSVGPSRPSTSAGRWRRETPV